jgi:hypothetical protein
MMIVVLMLLIVYPQNRHLFLDFTITTIVIIFLSQLYQQLLRLLVIVNVAGSNGVMTRKLSDEIHSHATYIHAQRVPTEHKSNV